MRTITGLFDTLDDAQRAANELMELGVPRDKISIVAREQGSEHIREHEVGGEDSAAEGAGAGAVGGTVVGGAVGLLVGAGLLAIPGIGPVLAIGPLAAAIGSAAAAVGAGALGAGIGAGVGGLAGGLIGAGVPEGTANDYAEGVRRGGTLLAATVDPAISGQIDDVLRRHGAVDIERRAAGWRADEGAGAFGGTTLDDSLHTTTDSAAAGGPYSSMIYDSPSGRAGAKTAGGSYSSMIYDSPSDRASTKTAHPADMSGVSITDPASKADPSSPAVLSDHRDEDTGEAWKDSSKVGTAAGVLSGAATGAALGSVAGPAGALIGGVAGAVVGGGAGAAGDVAGERAVPSSEYRGVGDERDRPLAGDDSESWATPTSAGMSGTVTPSGNFEYYKDDFHTHYRSTAMGGQPFELYEPAYRFGYQTGTSPRYPENSWEMAEPNLRREWEGNHPDSMWDDFKASVRYAWEKARGLR